MFDAIYADLQQNVAKLSNIYSRTGDELVLKVIKSLSENMRRVKILIDLNPANKE